MLRPQEIPTYEQLFDAAPQMLAILHVPTMTISHANQLMVNRLGYTRQELEGRLVYTLYHDGTRGDAHIDHDYFLANGYLRGRPRVLMTKWGEPVPAILNAQGWRGPGGNMIGSQTTWVEITPEIAPRLHLV